MAKRRGGRLVSPSSSGSCERGFQREDGRNVVDIKFGGCVLNADWLVERANIPLRSLLSLTTNHSTLSMRRRGADTNLAIRRFHGPHGFDRPEK